MLMDKADAVKVLLDLANFRLPEPPLCELVFACKDGAEALEALAADRQALIEARRERIEAINRRNITIQESRDALRDARAKLSEARKATSKLIGSALAVRKRNTTEFMVGLAEDLNIAEASIGGSDQCKFNGDGFVVSRAAMPTGEAQDAAK